MSEISSRPRVHQVSGAAANAVLKQGAVLVTSIVEGLLGSLPKLARQSHQSNAAVPAAPPHRPAPALAAVRRLFREGEQKKLVSTGLPPLETARVAALLEVSRTPYYVLDTGAVREALGRLNLASSLGKLAKSRDECIRTIETSHNVVVVRALVMACRDACLKIGFDRLDLRSGEQGIARVIATNAAGKTLVTEVTAGPRPKIETEVVGVSDGSCRSILDSFDAALEAEGVRSGPPSRKYTGGVCELAAARRFVREKLQPAVPARAARQREENGEQTRRRRQLNQRTEQFQRRV